MGRIPDDAWTEPTTGYWQRLDDAAPWTGRLAPPWRYGVPVLFTPAQVLVLPIRRLPGRPDRAVASLIANQAGFAVVSALARVMADVARPLAADIVIGLPTLGMVFAAPVAQALGHERWVPMGYSRKFWYDEALSTAVASITTPGPGKRIYLDPNQLPLVRGRRAVIVDDAISSARTALQVWDLLESLGVEIAGYVVAMRQGEDWRAALGPQRAERVRGAFDAPRLRLAGDGWWPESPTGAD